MQTALFCVLKLRDPETGIRVALVLVMPRLPRFPAVMGHIFTYLAVRIELGIDTRVEFLSVKG